MKIWVRIHNLGALEREYILYLLINDVTHKYILFPPCHKLLHIIKHKAS
jgi:hypothetical protein